MLAQQKQCRWFPRLPGALEELAQFLLRAVVDIVNTVSLSQSWGAGQAIVLFMLGQEDEVHRGIRPFIPLAVFRPDSKPCRFQIMNFVAVCVRLNTLQNQDRMPTAERVLLLGYGA